MMKISRLGSTLGLAPRGFGVLSAAFVALLLSACADVDGTNATDEETIATADQALFESSTMDGTAKLGLLASGAMSYLSQFDPLNPLGMVQTEYCGLIVKKTNGTYYGSAVQGQYQQLICTASVSPKAGESIVGYFHSHTPASVAGFSPSDKTNAKSSKRHYYVISTTNACGRKYNYSNGADTEMGCWPGSW